MDRLSERNERRLLILSLIEIAGNANHLFKGKLRVCDYAQTFSSSSTAIPCGFSIREVARPFAWLPLLVPFTSREILRRTDDGRITVFDKRIESYAKSKFNTGFVIDY